MIRHRIPLQDFHSLLATKLPKDRIPPKYSVAMVAGYLKGKSAIQIHREMLGVKKGFTGKSFWSRGYCVSTVGLDEKTVREYVKNQDEHDKRQDELDFD